MTCSCQIIIILTYKPLVHTVVSNRPFILALGAAFTGLRSNTNTWRALAILLTYKPLVHTVVSNRPFILALGAAFTGLRSNANTWRALAILITYKPFLHRSGEQQAIHPRSWGSVHRPAEQRKHMLLQYIIILLTLTYKSLVHTVVSNRPFILDLGQRSQACGANTWSAIANNSRF